MQIALVAACFAVGAQERPANKPDTTLPQVTVTGVSRDPVEKSYRKMVQGMDLFERSRGRAPEAQLRFKLLPRKPGTDMEHILLEVVGSTFAYEVPIGPDRTFTLQRDPKALQENAVVSPNRKRLSMTWRTDIRTPGLPPNTRRLGDLRLECQVGLEAGLESNRNPFLAGIASLFSDPKSYCDRKDPKYLFFADKPIFSVTLANGPRREVLATDQLYAMATDDRDLKNDLPFCDCEVLLDRTYFLPLGDRSWPDETLVEFEFMDEPAAQAGPVPVQPGTGKAQVAAAMGRPIAVTFDNGYEVWVYRQGGGRDQRIRAMSETVVLFSREGVVVKSRARPGYAVAR